MSTKEKNIQFAEFIGIKKVDNLWHVLNGWHLDSNLLFSENWQWLMSGLELYGKKNGFDILQILNMLAMEHKCQTVNDFFESFFSIFIEKNNSKKVQYSNLENYHVSYIAQSEKKRFNYECGYLLEKLDENSGYDLKAWLLEEPIIILPKDSKVIPTSLRIQLKKGCEAQVRGRSGLASKNKIFAHIGTIDSGYRGEICAILYNLGTEPFMIRNQDRIAQLVILELPKFVLNKVDSITKDDSIRKEGGFGSTGIK